MLALAAGLTLRNKKARRVPGFFTRCDDRVGLGAYFEEEDFFEPPRDEVDLRADDFEAFFAPDFRDALDFFAPDFEPDREVFEELFDEDFLLVAGDFAIANILSFPSKKGTGIAAPAVPKKPPSGGFSLITRKRRLSLSTDIFRLASAEAAIFAARAFATVATAALGESR